MRFRLKGITGTVCAAAALAEGCVLVDLEHGQRACRFLL